VPCEEAPCSRTIWSQKNQAPLACVKYFSTDLTFTDRDADQVESVSDRQQAIMKAIQEVNARISTAERNIKSEIERTAIDIIGANVATVHGVTLVVD
jgi:hypothetical protein